MGTNSNRPNKKPVNSALVTALILLGLVLVIVIVAISPSDDPAGKFWFIVIALLFVALLVIATVYNQLQKRMVQEMKLPSLDGPGEPDRPREEKSTPPPHPFEYQAFDHKSPFRLSAQAEALLNRVRSLHQQFKYNLTYSAVFTWAFYLPLAATYLFIPNILPGSTTICFGMIAALIIASLRANPKKTSAEMTVLIWGGLNAVGVGIIIIGMLSALYHLFTESQNALGPVIIVVLSGIVLLGSGLFHLYLGNKLRQETNAARPMCLLILWVFGPQQSLLKILGDIGMYWRLAGSVQFLQGGEYTLDMNQVISFIGGNRNILTRTREQLKQKLQGFRYTPGWDGVYPAHSLLCGDAVWKLAIDFFLKNSDVVAMNLCGFSPSNQGCLYELSLLVDRIPTRRMLFLADDTTDMDFLIETLNQKWDTMPADSPNHTATASPVMIYRIREGAANDRESMLKLFFETASSPLHGGQAPEF